MAYLVPSERYEDMTMVYSVIVRNYFRYFLNIDNFNLNPTSLEYSENIEKSPNSYAIALNYSGYPEYITAIEELQAERKSKPFLGR
jgi:hypothetical protein